MSPTAKLIFGKLCQFAGENGQAYPSYSTLSKEVGVERRQAMRGVKELVDYGLIRPEGRVRGNGGYASNVYVFLWHRIFFTDDPTDPGVTKDTRGDVTNVTSPRCHPRHHMVSDMTPKENHTRESDSEETTTEKVRLLLSETDFMKTSESELQTLIKRHGSERVMQAADIAAESWRRKHMEIHNPGGYLQALCEDLVIPEWYEPLHVRAAKAEAAAERKHAEDQRQIEEKVAEEQGAQERNDYWHSLSEEARQKFIDDIKVSSPFGQCFPEDGAVALARLAAWDYRRQMITNTGFPGEPSR